MSEEKTKKKVKSKITSFHAYRDELENPDMDQFLRESIRKEADELEKRLNSDPKLAGISASDDMFDMIVGKLKEEGYWEEEEEDDNANTEYADIQESGLKDGVAEDEEKPPEDREKSAPDVEKQAEAKEKLPVDVEKLAEAKEKHSVDVEKLAEAREKFPVDVEKLAETREELPEKKFAENRDMENSLNHTDEVLARLYEEQPEEVIRLIERGRRAEQEEKERARRRVRRNKFVRRATAVAAAFVLLIGAGFSTEARRGWILKMWDAAMEGFGFKAATDNVNNGVEARAKSDEEQAALSTIKESLEVFVPDFAYLPEKMEFLGYEIVEEGWFARLFYEYEQNILNVKIIKINEEGVSYYVFDQKAKLIDTVVNAQNIEMNIWETNLEMDPNAYVAEFEFEGCRYVINGMLPLEEMKKILKIAIIL